MPENTCLGKKAQASAETLIVFLIFLSAFGIIYAASSRLAASAQSHLDISLSQKDFSEFSSKLASACSLGNGNAREAWVKGKPAELSMEGNSVIFAAGSFSARVNSTCEISLSTNGPARAFHIENKEGVLEIN